MRIFDDRLEVWNPGLLPPPLTVEKLKGKHDSMPRNPLIAKMFFWIKYAEEVGSGTNKIVQWCKEWGLPEPTYEEAGGSFVTVFYNPKPEEGSQNRVVETVEKAVEMAVEKIIALIKTDPQITQKELMDKTGLTRRGIEWNLKKLKDEKKIRRVGPDKGGHWEVVEGV